MRNRLSEIAHRLPEKTDPLDKSRFPRVLKIQVEILSRIIDMGEEGYWVLRDKRYEDLVSSMWKGKYLEAMKSGESLLSEIKRAK